MNIYIYIYICIYTLSLYAPYSIKIKMHPQGFSRIWRNSIPISGPVPRRPGPVHGPWPREQPTFGVRGISQSPPRCLTMSPQRAIFTKLDLPKVDYYAPWGLEASQCTIVHLGEVQLGKNGPLWRYSEASGGALRNFGSPKCRLLPGS